MDQLYVLGNPISHSLSPIIHQAFAKQLNIELQYQRKKIELGMFNKTLDQLITTGMVGASVTVPFKIEAYHYAHETTPRAKQAGAVNTLKVINNKLCLGDNTDGVGLVNDIKINKGWIIDNKHILVLGAGGAVRGILGALLAEQPASLTIVNRNYDKAKQLQHDFQKLALQTNLITSDHLDRQQHFDIIINGTAASLQGVIPAAVEHLDVKNSFCYDLMYDLKPTSFYTWAKQQKSLAVADGLGMLIEQAAEAFQLWYSVKPETQSPLKNILTDHSVTLKLHDRVN